MRKLLLRRKSMLPTPASRKPVMVSCRECSTQRTWSCSAYTPCRTSSAIMATSEPSAALRTPASAAGAAILRSQATSALPLAAAEPRTLATVSERSATHCSDATGRAKRRGRATLLVVVGRAA